MQPGEDYTDAEIRKRFRVYYGDDDERELEDGQIPFFREKWASLSELMKEIKQIFSRFYNKLHNRKGYFWSERFKSVIVDNGETLINCLAYIDLNPVRAGIVKRPEAYRWCSLGYHVQIRNRDEFLSLDLGLREFGVKDEKERLITVEWAQTDSVFPVSIQVEAWDRVGLVRDITTMVADEKVNIAGVNLINHDDQGLSLYFTLEMRGLAQLSLLLAKMEGIRGVVSVVRTGDGTTAKASSLS